ncbi:MAG: hypothetical protein Fur002_05480 [Anaerolineales bacterium]
MKILIVTTEWERYAGDISGIHVRQQAEALRRAGVEVDVFPFRGKKNLLNYWRAAQELKQLNLAQYDLIHAHHGQSGVVALAQKIRPMVVTFHGSDLQGIRAASGRVTLIGYALRAASRLVARRADSVIVVAQNLARQLPRGVAYQVIPAGINLDVFHPMPQEEARRALNLPLDAKLVLFVGDPTRTEKRFWLAQQASKLLSAQLVTAHGVPFEHMPLYMNACDALLVTSSTEGSPNAVKEALACNLPVVSTDVGDVRQQTANIAGCEICADDSPAALAAALTRALNLPTRINAQKAAAAFDEKVLIEKIIQIYRSLL